MRVFSIKLSEHNKTDIIEFLYNDVNYILKISDGIILPNGEIAFKF